MPIAINGSGTVTGISAGGLPDGVITADELATAVKPLGVSQTWTDVTASRAFGTTYTNSTGRPIFVAVTIGRGGNTTISGAATFSIDGTVVSSAVTSESNGTSFVTNQKIHSFIIPDGSTYLATNSVNSAITYWWELR